MGRKPDGDTVIIGFKFTQRAWRIGGGVALAGAAVMVLYGARFSLGATRPELFVYWGGFLLLLLLALYAALLDLRYIRLQYHLAQREIFHETLGSEDFRSALRKAQEAEGNGKKADN